jgi:hypothetical protein
MSRCASLFLLTAVFFGLVAGCSDNKKSVQTPTEQAPPPPKSKSTPSKAL